MSNNTLLSIFLLIIIDLVFIREIQSKSFGHYKYNNYGIVGGKNTTIEQHPFQVALLVEINGNKSETLCGGSIISARYILTAGHCVHGFSVVHVRVGSTYCIDGGTVYTSNKLFTHPHCDTDGPDYDVALIDLGRNIELDGKTTKAISLPAPGTVVQPGTNVIVTGWGLTKEKGYPSKQLKEVTIQTISNADCNKIYGKKDLNVTQRMFCAGKIQGGEGPCQGDSGGPVVDTESGVQLGVVSWGYGCARPGYPAVFADLTNAEIRNWIKNRTGV